MDKRKKNRGSSGNNRKKGSSFLEKNKAKQGVIETSSGLQYLIVDAGEGDSPDDDSNVTIHQRCLLVDGKIILDTFKENEASECKVDELIDGLAEGLKLMNKGARFKFFIPPHLGWGKKGSSNKIPPESVSIFDVRLIDFW
jgi:FKBP-type peptidyl-prolyl cis-trans isomerase FkpA